MREATKSRKLYPTKQPKGQSYDLTDGAVSTVGCSCEEEVVITCNIILPVWLCCCPPQHKKEDSVVAFVFWAVVEVKSEND